MGTPGYMSPEQARAHAMTKATDVWSFGVVLFEALAGVHPFARETLPDMLSAILNDPPPWARLPHTLPRAWRVLLERCLRKSEHDRLHDIADVRIEIEEAPETELPLDGRGDALLPRWARWARWAIAIMATLSALVLWSFWRSSDPPERPPGVVRRFVIELPPTATLSLDGASGLTVSPDGTRLVYAARRADRSQLRQRTLDQLETVPIPGTEGGVGPFFSANGDALGFFADGKLKTLSFPGTPVTLTDAPTPRGASWSPSNDGRILFSPASQGGLIIVAETGGTADNLTAISPDSGDSNERLHRWPSLLPDGTAALVTLWNRDRVDIGIVELSTGRVSSLVDNGSYARYAPTGPTGHLVFPTSFSPDGKTLAYTELHPETGLDVWTLAIDSDEARPLLATGFAEAGAMFSPDGS